MEEYTSFLPVPRKDTAFAVYMTGITYDDPKYKMVRTCSPFYTFMYVLEGEGIVIENNTKFAISQSSVVILHQHSSQKYYTCENNPLKFMWINARGSMITHALSDYSIKNLIVVNNLDLQSYFEEIMLISGEKKHVSYQDIYDKILLVLLNIIQTIAKHNSVPKVASADAVMLKDFIDRRIDKKLSVSSMADYLNKSEVHTHRLFKSAFGISPYEYLLSRKFEAAKNLLEMSTLSVKEIAYHLAFSDEHHFSKCFKAKTGKSPTQHRKHTNNIKY